MSPKGKIVLADSEKELRNFLERITGAGPVTVDVDGILYLVQVDREKDMEQGRRFLLQGGPDTDD